MRGTLKAASERRLWGGWGSGPADLGGGSFCLPGGQLRDPSARTGGRGSLWTCCWVPGAFESPCSLPSPHGSLVGGGHPRLQSRSVQRVAVCSPIVSLREQRLWASGRPPGPHSSFRSQSERFLLTTDFISLSFQKSSWQTLASRPFASLPREVRISSLP